SSATRDGRPDVQIAPESHENEIVQALHELTSAEIARGKRQDQLLNYILKALEALKGRQDTRDASQEAIRRQLAAIQSLLKSHPRRSDPLPLSANAQNTHGARPGRIPLPETAQRDTDERSVPASQQDKLPHDIQQQVFRFMQQEQEQQQQHHQSNPNRPNFQM
ncbi:hypothetical protein PMIN04_013165, partial [Paraphaeosphaeria minitans]